MAVRVMFDNTHNVIEPTFLLANRRGNRLGYVPATSIHWVDNMNSGFEVSFQVHKYIDGVLVQLWDKIEDFKLLYCPEINMWFEIHVEVEEGNQALKHVSAISVCEAELSQINLYGIEINTEIDIERDDYSPTVLYNPDDPQCSLLDRILEKAPHYSIGHVDNSIAGIQRTFTFDSKSIYDSMQDVATEIGCIFTFDSGTNTDGKIAREINVYDLKSYCPACKMRGDFIDKCSECGNKDILPGYGEDTNIFVSVENLADTISYSTDTGSVKNCFKLEAGDEFMTATIANCNPSGSNYIWYLSDKTREDMTQELREALAEYDRLYEYYQNEHISRFDEDIVSEFNTLTAKYSAYRNDLPTIQAESVGFASLVQLYYWMVDLYLYLHDELMPSVEIEETNAEKQAVLLTSSSLSPVAVPDLSVCSESSARSAALAMAKTVVDPRFRVKANVGSFENNVWTGTFIVENYSDEEDSATTKSINVTVNEDYETYVKQRIDKVLQRDSGEVTDIKALFKLETEEFEEELRKYCLASLESFMDSCQSCVDILIEQGVANKDDKPDLYESLYAPYYDKLLILQAEVKVREEEIEVISGVYDSDGYLSKDGMQTLIQAEMDTIHKALDLESVLGREKWLEFSAYRREDTYRNDNYVSTGLSNNEVISMASEFIKTASEEIVKSATLQHSITATLKNLLTMKEFIPIVDNFKTGNWIRVRVDKEIFKLRLISYEIDFDSVDSITVEFSDVLRVADGLSDCESILKQAASMTTSYGAVQHQASQAASAKDIVSGWVSDGLALTQLKIVNNAKDQDVSWDKHGLLCRQYLPITETYDDKQLKIINRGLYTTTDGWRTSSTGIGDFVFYNPETGKMEEAYGVIADTLIGNLILSEKVGIYNTDNSIVLDKNGLVITTNGDTVTGDQKVFTIRKRDKDGSGNDIYSNLFYVDADGDIVFAGKLNGASGTFTGDVTALSLTIDGQSAADYIDNRAETIVSPVQESLDDLIDIVDGKTTIFYSGTEPDTAVTNDIWYNTTNHTILRRTASGWTDITDEALSKALTAAGDAQATADGKIVTFAQNSAPTAAATGDLWIDTDDNNKLYRWNGTSWVEYRDKTIAVAQSKANDAYNYAVDIWNGTKGIYFSNSAVGSVSIDKTSGIKVVGTDNSYFQAKNDAMGFFRSDGTAMLYYEDGDMVLSGIISAKGGFIGGENGWVIGEACLYNNNATTLGTADGVYIGTDGISIGEDIILSLENSSLNVSGKLNISTSDFSLSLVRDDGNDVVMDIDEEGNVTFGNEVYASNVRQYIPSATYNASDIGGMQGFADLLKYYTYGSVILNYDVEETVAVPVRFEDFVVGSATINSSSLLSAPQLHFVNGTGNFEINNLNIGAQATQTATVSDLVSSSLNEATTGVWVESGNVLLRNCWVRQANIGIWAGKNGKITWICDLSDTEGICTQYFAGASGGGDIAIYGSIPGDSNENTLLLEEGSRGTVRNTTAHSDEFQPAEKTSVTTSIGVQFGWYSGTGGWKNDGYMYQGYTNGKGKCWGCIKPDLSLIPDGAIIESASLSLTRDSGVGSGSNVTVNLHYSATSYGSKPTGLVNFLSKTNSIGTGQTKSYNVLTGVQAIYAGSAKQLVLYTGESSPASNVVYSRHYARYSKASLSVTYLI